MDLENKTVTSKMYSINWKDFLRGLLVSCITAVVTVFYNSAMSGEPVFQKEKVISAAIIAGCSYLLKNFFTPSISIPIQDSEINVNDPKAAK